MGKNIPEKGRFFEKPDYDAMNNGEYDLLYGYCQASSPRVRDSNNNIATLTVFSTSAPAPNAVSAATIGGLSASMDYAQHSLPPAYEQLYRYPPYYAPQAPASVGYNMPMQPHQSAVNNDQVGGIVNYLPLAGGEFNSHVNGGNPFGSHVLLATANGTVSLQPPPQTQQIILATRRLSLILIEWSLNAH